MPQKKLLLDEMGIDDIETLFSDIPISARRTLDFSDGMPEKEVQKLFASKASLNIPATGFANFLGGEYQSRYSPAALQYLMSRGELLTAYTSYQPEISQGMLQGLFEYQSMMAELTAMETVNASLYDGATGLGEALCLSNRGNRRNVFLLPSFIPAWKKQIANNYISGFGGKIVYYSHDEETGGANLENIRSLISSQGDKLGAAYVEMPNSLGVLDERVLELKQTLGQAHLIVGVDPISLALVKPPGEYGADIVIGEGQPLGLPLGFGGPTLGILGVNKTLVRKMPGRVVGATHDSRGNRAFCITLQTREQHIRREKATSNICSNEAHCALTAAAFMALHGASGLKNLASLLLEKSHSLAKKLGSMPGFHSPAFTGPFFSSFAVQTPIAYSEINKALLSKGIHGGASLKGTIPGGENMALFSVNETIPETAFEDLAAALAGIKVPQETKGWGGDHV